MSDDHEKYLRRAIEIATESRAAGGSPFASLLVDADGAIIAEDHNTVGPDDDITAHPELKLARWAARELTPDAAAETVMYTSCQPCDMCAGAIERAGLLRVVYALSSEGFASLNPSETFRPVPILAGGLAAEARAAVEGYFD
ncbi:MAG: nucleoside deaminase [Aeromicrobium sp.]